VGAAVATPEDAPIWQPTPAQVEGAGLTRFARWLEAERGVETGGDYFALQRWSTENVAEFWRAVWDYFEVLADGSPEPVLGSRAMPGAEWFPGARLNWAEHAFRGRDDDEAVALVHCSEIRELRETTWGELRAEVARVAAGLRELGVGEGDRVVAYLPNVAEAVAAFLAVASIGAVWSSASPDFGAEAVVDRFAQIEPKVLLCVDGYRYSGRDFDRREVVGRLREAMPSLEHTVLVPYLDPEAELPGAVAWADLGGEGPHELTFNRVPFSAPLWVLYSSGTTGLPKAIVQSQGGILLECLKKMRLHIDLGPEDRFFWFTTTGWMMWNVVVAALLTEAPAVLFDGNPGHPDMGRLWDLAEEAGVTVFGTSAAFVSASMKAGVVPEEGRDLSRIRAVGSTGSPLAPEGFDWLYEHLGSGLWLFSTSGGSDVCTSFVGPVPTIPVHRGELQAPLLGVALAAFDPEGNPVTGEVGELVVTEPMPSMPVFFGGDEDGSRYHDAYFDTYPGVWRHGDWIELTAHGGAVIYGRSDSTINRGGVRIGSAEIYRALEPVEEVLDALVVDLPKADTDGWICLFVVLRGGAELDEDLEARIARAVRGRTSPRHVPDAVYAIAEVPRTLSGKVLEVPVKRILSGEDPEKAASRGSLANPAALDAFSGFAERFAAES
jgi:acetoacetyl-CoA synthetase